MEVEQNIPEAVTSPQDSLSAKAAHYFEKASGSFSASIAGQAACIASFCKEDNFSPADLLTSLQQDEARITDLLKTANKVHRQKQNGPRFPSGRVKSVSRERVLSIINDDFSLAERMMVLTPDQIKRLKSHYKEYKDTIQRRSISGENLSYNEIRIEEEEYYQLLITDTIELQYEQSNS